MILSDARTRVLRLVDDETDRVRFPTDGELDNALATGQQESYMTAVGCSREVFAQEVALSTDANGQLSLTSQLPVLPLLNVVLTQGNARFKVPPGRFDNSFIFASGIQPLRIRYIASAAFPASAGAAFTWGHSNVVAPLLDQLMLCLAAGELGIKDGVQNAMNEKRKDELRLSIEKNLSGGSWSVVPLDSLSGGGASESPFEYLMTAPMTLQLTQKRWGRW